VIAPSLGGEVIWGRMANRLSTAHMRPMWNETSTLSYVSK